MRGEDAPPRRPLTPPHEAAYDPNERHRVLLLAVLDLIGVRYDEIATVPEDIAIARVLGPLRVRLDVPLEGA